MRVLCATGHPLRLTTWLAVPLLFAGAVLGLVGLAGLLLGLPGDDIALSSALFGAATAVTTVAGASVTWTAGWQRRWLRWSYPVTVLGAGIAADGVRLPVAVVVAVGVPSIALLVVRYFVERRRAAALAEAGRAPRGGCP